MKPIGHFLAVASTLLGALALASQTLAAPHPASRPNIVILLADDLGYRDVSFHDGEIATPHIDRIANEGVRLDRFYACPVCSPTRAGLMTGRYPIRYGLMRTVIAPWRDYGLSTDEVTLADVLGKAGYTHRGVFGKWHLGHQRLKWHPLRRGFTQFHGHYNGALDYFTHIREGECDWHNDYEPSDEQGYTTDLIGAAAAEFISEHASDGAPFFCYVPFNAPHDPLQAKPKDLEKYRHLADKHSPGRQKLAGMIAGLDDAVGVILDAIDEAGISDNTLVLFFSDNGGTNVGDNRPWRGGKATVFEGGTRVAAAMRWPQSLPAGGTVIEPVMYIDVLPTLMRLAGVDDHGGLPLDGVDAWNAITGKRSIEDREMFSSVHGNKYAVWSEPWKLVIQNQRGGEEMTFLFDLQRDPGETTNLANDHPKVVEQLTARIEWFKSLKPEYSIPDRGVGQQGFQAPKHWDIRAWEELRAGKSE